MDRIKSLLKTRAAIIAMAACAVLAVLTAVFFLQPGPGKRELPADATSLAQEESVQVSEQAQGLLSLIDVDAVLRQALAQSNAPVTENTAAATSPVVFPESHAAQTQPGSPPTAQAVTTTARPQASAAMMTTTKSPGGTSVPTTTTTKAATTAPSTTTPITQTTTKAQLTCTIAIRCDTLLSSNNLEKLSQAKQSIVPSNGVILQTRTISFTEGESVFDVLKRVTQSEKIHMVFDNNPMYSSAYIAAIGNLYERDCGELSGWMYRVNGTFPGYGCGKYALKAGDIVEWLYTCDLGWDIGGGGVTQR